MTLIIGGASQGKLVYAQKMTGMDDELTADCASCPVELLKDYPLWNRLHKLVERFLRDGKDPVPAVLKLVESSPEVTIICDEIGCGVVPMDPFERRLRDAVGHVCCALVTKASRVDRVFCGIPTTIYSSEGQEISQHGNQ